MVTCHNNLTLRIKLVFTKYKQINEKSDEGTQIKAFDQEPKSKERKKEKI